MLILPGSDLFEITLSTIPPVWAWSGQISGDHVSFVADCETGLLRPVDPDGLEEYALGGEYEQRLSQMEEEDELGEFDHDSDPEYD
jgi:hypothetical protein